MRGSARTRELHQVAGCTGSGKTTIAAWLLETRGPRRMLISDPLARESSSLSARLGSAIYTDAETLHAALGKVRPGDEWRATLIPPIQTEARAAGWLADLATWCGEHLGDVWLVYEEASGSLPHGRVHPSVRTVAQRGRHFGVSILTCTQRPVSVDPDVRAELRAGSTWLGRLADTNELDFARKLRGKAFADRVARLEVIDEAGYATWLRLPPSGEPEQLRISFKRGRAVIAASSAGAGTSEERPSTNDHDCHTLLSGGSDRIERRQ